MTWLLLLSLLAAGSLAGCIDEPRPFRPALKPLPAQLAGVERDHPIIVVTPVEGLAPPLDRELSDAMYQALAKRSLPVATDAKSGGDVVYMVGAHFTPASAAGALRRPAALVWEVRDANGELVSRYAQKLALEANPASSETRAALVAAIAREPADMVVKGIEGDAPLPGEEAAASGSAAASAGAGRSLVVDDIKGAPAQNGDTALRQTIVYALKAAGIKVLERKAADSLVLSGAVETARLDNAFEHVKVTWSLRRADGGLVGEVSQENNVPTRLLTEVWGEIASAVAQNAAGGIAALIDQAMAAKTP